MPLITTHSYFAEDLLSYLPKTLSNKLQENQYLYTLFAQGFDPFLFYEFLKIKKQNLQNYFHTHQTDLFFINFINSIKSTKDIDNPYFLEALYGHLAHYVLDSTLHPFIIYKTGIYEKEKKETKKYKGGHTILEMQLDAYLYTQKTEKKYQNFKIHQHISKDPFPRNLIDLLNTTYEKTFNIKNLGSAYEKGCKKMYYAYKFLIEDSWGLKKRMYSVLDFLNPKSLNQYSSFSNHIKTINREYFNLNHQIWFNPWCNHETSNASIFDLYEEDKKRAILLFKATDKFLNNKISLNDYKKILKDDDYTTGKSWTLKKELKHLEF